MFSLFLVLRQAKLISRHCNTTALAKQEVVETLTALLAQRRASFLQSQSSLFATSPRVFERPQTKAELPSN